MTSSQRYKEEDSTTALQRRVLSEVLQATKDDHARELGPLAVLEARSQQLEPEIYKPEVCRPKQRASFLTDVDITDSSETRALHACYLHTRSCLNGCR